MLVRYLGTLIALLCLAGSAAKADLKPVDCSATPFVYSGQALNVDCERSEDYLRVDESSGSVRIDVITVSSNDRQIFFTMVSQLITAPRIYMEHRSLGESFHSVFEHAEAAEWKGVGNKSGYDIAEFTTDISGQPSHCVTVQRYTNAAFTGFKRHLIGMGCTIGDRQSVYDILAKLAAPGD
jgi:hypothetical protein